MSNYEHFIWHWLLAIIVAIYYVFILYLSLFPIWDALPFVVVINSINNYPSLFSARRQRLQKLPHESLKHIGCKVIDRFQNYVCKYITLVCSVTWLDQFFVSGLGWQTPHFVNPHAGFKHDFNELSNDSQLYCICKT